MMSDLWQEPVRALASGQAVECQLWGATIWNWMGAKGFLSHVTCGAQLEVYRTFYPLLCITAHAHVHAHVCMCACVHVCMCACVHAHVHVHVYCI